MAITLPYPTLTVPLVPAELEANHSTIASKFGQIDSSDIASGAGIDPSTQLSAAYEYITVPITITKATVGASWPASGVMGWAPIYNDSKGNFTAVGYQYVCSDIGGKTGTFRIRWGYYLTTGSLYGSPTTLVNSVIIGTGGTADTPYMGGASISVEVPFDTNQRFLYVEATGADATTMTNTTDQMVVSVHLRRLIKGA